ncbi:MAG: glutamate 5-kinase [Leadbetterella sp.]|nr:glutamate 5-kinase [Leadbetterella sp.]
MKRDLLVIKFGTASITRTSGEPDLRILEEIARQVAELHKTHRIVLVSSGAVGAGKRFIRDYESQISQKKAAAAIGNPLLLKMYDEVFSRYGITVAQSLLERQHFANRGQFLQLKETYEELWRNQVIPIANENDVVSNRELKFSDNDELATLIAGGFGARLMMLCTASGGLLNSEGQLLTEVPEIDETVLSYVIKSGSALGSGGMASKLTFTHLANKMGIRVVIFGMKEADGILDAFNGRTGTTFTPRPKNLRARNKWLASGGVSVGKIVVDEGAAAAVRDRKSLLMVGVKAYEGDFTKGELVEILTESEEVIGVGKVKVSAAALTKETGRSTIIIHTNDLVLL